MKLFTIPFVAFALAAAPTFAQQSGLTDAGVPNDSAVAGTAGGASFGTACGTGTTTTTFVSNNSFAGNMFDIAPSVDMTINCLDVHWDVVESIDVAIWWCPGTVVGNDKNQLLNWVQFATGTATGAGLGLPSNVVLTPVTTNPVFSAGSTYGIYVQVVNYATTAGFLRYTNVTAPTLYPGTHCDLTAYYGKGDGITSSTFSFRAWNGTLYTDVAGPPGPSLALSGTCPGPVTLTASNCTAGGMVAMIYGAAGTFTQTGSPCTGLTVDIAAPTLGGLLVADGAGSAAVTFNAPAAACGLTVQAVDVGTCTTTNTITL
jgi:hypothetical protein